MLVGGGPADDDRTAVVVSKEPTLCRRLLTMQSNTHAHLFSSAYCQTNRGQARPGLLRPRSSAGVYTPKELHSMTRGHDTPKPPAARVSG